MAKDFDDLELDELRDTVRRLRSEIRLLEPVVSIEEENGATDVAAAADAGDSIEALKHRRELQSELQDTLHRLGEALEMARIETVARQAVDSGLVTEPFQLAKVGNCPLCFEDIAEQRDCNTETGPHRRFMCCGVRACEACSIKYLQWNVKSHMEAQARMLNLPPPENEEQAMIMQLILAERGVATNQLKLPQCPFCRSELHRSKAEERAMILRNAELGMSWAQSLVGDEMLREYARTGDMEIRSKAMSWIALAAEQGCLDAQIKLALGNTAQGSSNSNSNTTAQLLQTAASQGHARAQLLCAEELGLEDARHDDWKMDLKDEAWIWMTLAAAQGSSDACDALGQYWASVTEAPPTKVDDCEYNGDEQEDCNDNAVAVFRAYYWFKMAAVKGHRSAQLKTAALLLQIKKILFGKDNHVGYSCYPEVVFWTRQFQDPRVTPAALGAHVSKDECACCGKRSNGVVANAVRIRLCTKCHSIGYCSRECQRKHWNLGHKVDCQKVDLLEKALKARTTAVLSSTAKTKTASSAPSVDK